MNTNKNEAATESTQANTNVVLSDFEKFYLDKLDSATKATRTAQGAGAWAIACHMAGGLAIDESKVHVEAALQSVGRNKLVLKNSMKLVPFAVALRDEIGSNEFPARKTWPTKEYAEDILRLAGKTPSQAVDEWKTLESDVVETVTDELSADLVAKGIKAKPTKDRVASAIKTASNKLKTPSSGESDKWFDFLNDTEKLKAQLVRLNKDQLKAVEKAVEDVSLLGWRKEDQPDI